MSSIYDQYLEQRGKLVRSYITPTRITFSPAGHMRAMKENIDSSAFMPATESWGTPTYGGLPYSVVREQVDEIKLHNAMTDSFRQNAITVKIDGIMGAAPVVDIVAANLSAAQLCEIARAWLDADCQKWGEFEKALDKVITEHGCFE